MEITPLSLLKRIDGCEAVADFRRRYGATPPEVFIFGRTHQADFTSAAYSLQSVPMLKARSQFVADVLTNRPLCKDHYRLTLLLPDFPSSGPGQFVQVACRDPLAEFSTTHEITWTPGDQVPIEGIELRAPLSLLRKPFSLAARRDLPNQGGVELDIIHRTVGTGTTWMSGLKAGDKVNLIGPLGNRFPEPGPGQVAIMVGGGVGIPPMIYFSSTLVGRKSVAFAGSLNRDLLPLTITADAPTPGPDQFQPHYAIQEFAQYGTPAVVCTDDGSWGYRGLVTQALESYLDAYFAKSPEQAIIYTCGPEGMMRRIATIAEARKITCYVSVERAMACGMGTCQSCVIKTISPTPDKPWVFKLACTDGPIFESKKLLW